MLRLDPADCTEERLKAAFRVFDNADAEGKGSDIRRSVEDSLRKTLVDARAAVKSVSSAGSFGDGAITRGELMALRDDDRRLSGLRIEGLEEPGSSSTVVPCFHAR